ncbi:MAG: MMPL family transporter, partial [Candidatus Margulisbacteria bacterium]|nr:MMPL family transporter [Candidatus Margulisiibacteriota bacterium]
LKSILATFATVLVVFLSVMTALGLAGWLGIQLTVPSSITPVIILTLAIADSIHILMTFIQKMQSGMEKLPALKESMRLNLQPVFLTSFTTIIGFLCLNFSDSPPIHDLGNITAMGVVAAFIYSVLLLPIFIIIVPFRFKKKDLNNTTLMDRLSAFVIRRYKPILIGMTVFTILMLSLIPSIRIDDQFVDYFDHSIPFRSDTDYITDHLTGIYQIEYSLDADFPGGISEPDYLNKVESFANWFREKPGVIHVSSFTDIMKRLNRTMNGDDDTFYKIPSVRELAAQYLLLYELSLPFGLDLNNQINIDKSSTRFSVTVDKIPSSELKALSAEGEAWLRDNGGENLVAEGSSPALMFSHISVRNIEGMVKGTLFALVLITISMMIALKSVRYGLISLIPNVVPIILAFGLWRIVNGQIGFTVSTVAATTIGIIVDDSVHFLSKYLRAQREHQLDAEEAVTFSFKNVGIALLATSVILVCGFAILSQSSFYPNQAMGILSAITIAMALFADFLLLPAALIYFDKKKETK